MTFIFMYLWILFSMCQRLCNKLHALLHLINIIQHNWLEIEDELDITCIWIFRGLYAFPKSRSLRYLNFNFGLESRK
jgi:hypothetical protein